MTQVIEEAVKALAEFEAELDRIKTDASEAKKRLVKAAADEAEKAKSDALAKAQELANMGKAPPWFWRGRCSNQPARAGCYAS